MKKFLIVNCLLLVVCSFAGATVDLAEIGVGARPLSLGRAFAGGMEDASSIFTNPAGLAMTSGFKAVSMNGTLLSDTNYMVLGMANNAPVGKVGIGYVNASVPSIPLTTVEGTGANTKITQSGLTDYSSSMLFLTYATRLSRIFKGKLDNLSFGASYKLFLQGFSGGGSVMQDASGAGMDADMGFIWELAPWASLGFTANNFLPESLGGRFIWQKNNLTEGIPASLRAGGSFKILGDLALHQHEDQELTLLLDYETGKGSNRPSVWHAGLEYWPLSMLALRVGMDQKGRADESGIGVDSNLTGGVGIDYHGFTFDFAYHQFGELAQNATYFFSIGYQGEDKSQRKRKKARRSGALPFPEVAPKPPLSTFTDLPQDYWARSPIEYLATLGIMGGYPDNTFRPDQPVTRGELAVILVKAKEFKVEKAAKSNFKDVGADHKFAPYIDIAVKRKYMNGYPDGSFRPDKRVTRAEAAAIFAKFSGLYVKPKVEQQVFPDLPKYHWASPSVAASKEMGYFEYLAGSDFSPEKYLRRAEAAEILSKTVLVKEKIKKLISGED